MDQEKLDNQRDVVKNEKRQRYDNQPYGDWSERLQKLVYPEDASVSPHGDRLDGGPGRGDARGRRAVLQDVLRAEQRGADGRRRRRSGRGVGLGRALLRRDRAGAGSSPDPGEDRAGAEAGIDRARPRHRRRPPPAPDHGVSDAALLVRLRSRSRRFAVLCWAWDRLPDSTGAWYGSGGSRRASWPISTRS